MFRFTLLLLALAPFIGAAPSAQTQTHAGTVTMEFDLSGQGAGQEARLWIPYPVSDRDQLIGDIEIKGDYAGQAIHTDRRHGTPILFVSWGKEAASRKLTLTFTVERQEVIRRDFPASEPAWNRDDYAEYLRPTSLGPTDGEVKKLADQITRGKKTVLAKAKALYDWTCENMYRDPAVRGCGNGDVCILLKTPGGKCTDIHSVYVALARASGVPAREVFGLRLGKKDGEDITGWQHCWAEFFLPGYGWVPVDAADVRKAMLVENLRPEDPKVKELRDYFWGGIDAYRFRLAVGRDVVLNPPQAGAPLNTFGYPYAEIGGKTADWLDPPAFAYKFTYRSL